MTAKPWEKYQEGPWSKYGKGAPDADSGNGFLAQANKGIANTIDFVNPFDNEVWKDIAGGRLYTGSAADWMRAGRVAVADRDPETIVEGLGRGVGNAAATMVPVTKALQVASTAPGILGNIADDAFRALASKGGAAAELTAGAVSGGAREIAEAAGAPDWAATTAEIVAPAVALPAMLRGVTSGARAVGTVAGKTPLLGTAMRAGRGILRDAMPMTEGGAREVARDELRRLAGGTQRAEEIAGRIAPETEIGLTPAQQTGDPALLGLERAAAAEDPNLRDRLIARGAAAEDTAQSTVRDMGGDPEAARRFLRDRIAAVKASMTERVDRVVAQAAEEVARQGPSASGEANSTRAVALLKSELDDALMQERALWGAVPKAVKVPTGATQNTIRAMIDETPWAQRRDIPADLREAFGENGVLGDETTVMELHGLYSEMRRVARSAMAGNDQNKNRARIANAVAEAILEDLGTFDPTSEVGRAVAEARIFSRTLHETFDQGTVGRILKRTIDGDETMSPEVALDRTVGTQGTSAAVAADDIRGAAPAATGNIQDYMRGRFADAIIDPSGNFSPKKAEAWLRANRDALLRFPDLQNQFRLALTSREAAEAFAARATAREKSVDTGSAAARYVRGAEEKAIPSILGADNPAAAAKAVRATAAKDPTGAALAGVKGAFSDYLIGNAISNGAMSGGRMQSLIRDPKISASLRQIFEPAEIERMGRIAEELAKLEAARGAAANASVIDRPANRIIDTVVRIAAARHGGNLGGGTMGGSLQAANIFTERARSSLYGLTNNRARQLLIDAIEDPELFKALLTEPASIKGLAPEIRSRLAPFLIGAVSSASDESGNGILGSMLGGRAASVLPPPM